jgi:hypothetical protein
MKTANSWPSNLIVAVLLVLTFFFWDQVWLFPVRAFVVFLHELSHGLAAILTGGSIDHIELSASLGGVCWSRGGWRLVVLPAGYLGSMAFGGLILVAAARLHADRAIAGVIGVIVLGVTALYVRSVFGLVFGAAFGLAMLLSARFLPEVVNDVLLKFLGLTSLGYAIIDIKEDLIVRTVPGSDAYAMSRELFLPPVFWGVLWIVIAVAATIVFLRIASGGRRG